MARRIVGMFTVGHAWFVRVMVVGDADSRVAAGPTRTPR